MRKVLLAFLALLAFNAASVVYAEDEATAGDEAVQTETSQEELPPMTEPEGAEPAQ